MDLWVTGAVALLGFWVEQEQVMFVTMLLGP